MSKIKENKEKKKQREEVRNENKRIWIMVLILRFIGMMIEGEEMMII